MIHGQVCWPYYFLLNLVSNCLLVLVNPSIYKVPKVKAKV
uniref:Uncharacterized protein n=1 Tax=Rhizophora mucronata TaxID=61149 RepID=A0A2P2IJ43_RHIMU